MTSQKQQVELQVLHPLNRLLILFSAPNKVIKKRHDMLLDYDNSVSKGVNMGDSSIFAFRFNLSLYLLYLLEMYYRKLARDLYKFISIYF